MRIFSKKCVVSFRSILRWYYIDTLFTTHFQGELVVIFVEHLKRYYLHCFAFLSRLLFFFWPTVWPANAKMQHVIRMKMNVGTKTSASDELPVNAFWWVFSAILNRSQCSHWSHVEKRPKSAAAGRATPMGCFFQAPSPTQRTWTDYQITAFFCAKRTCSKSAVSTTSVWRTGRRLKKHSEQTADAPTPLLRANCQLAAWIKEPDAFSKLCFWAKAFQVHFCVCCLNYWEPSIGLALIRHGLSAGSSRVWMCNTFLGKKASVLARVEWESGLDQNSDTKCQSISAPQRQGGLSAKTSVSQQATDWQV